MLSSTTHKTVKQVIARYEAGGRWRRGGRGRNYDAVAELVAPQVEAKRAVLGEAASRRPGPPAYAGSARNFRRLVAESKRPGGS